MSKHTTSPKRARLQVAGNDIKAGLKWERARQSTNVIIDEHGSRYQYIDGIKVWIS